MSLLQLLESGGPFPIVLSGILGLMVGSFLNVVVYRLPIMMDRAWRRESLDFLDLPNTVSNDQQPFDLTQPASHCLNCGSSVLPWQNIPVISYLLLGGRCARCKTRISIRYPLVETLTALLSAVVVWHYGWNIQAMMALILTWTLISLSLIDLDCQLLPDSITLPVLWIGLAISTRTIFADSHSAIIGAITGYLSLWSVYKIFKWLTGKEGMGFGDFKLLAMFGAWMGWQVLPVIILMSSFVGALTGSLMIVFGKHKRSMPIPFGPYLSAAGWIVLLWGNQLIEWYFKIIE